MFAIQVPVWEIAARTAIVFLAILGGLRLAGKREVGQLTVFDLVVLLLIANAVQNAMVGPDNSLVGGIVAAAVLLGLGVVLAQLRLRSSRLRHLVQGTPTVLLLHGEVQAAAMRREGLDVELLQAAVREHGVANLSDVEMAVLEVDGSISIVPVGEHTRRIRHPLRYLRRQ